MTLYETLTSHLFGQDEVLFEIADLLERVQEGMFYPGQPRASILLLGPTGVGKTECALIACEALCGDCEQSLARFDMSEFMTPDAMLNMLGTPGHKGVFERKWRSTQKRGFMLFDEIEKAHPDILNMLLQILSAGRLTTGDGDVLGLTDYIICATTNIGSKILLDSKDDRWEVIRDRTISEALQVLSPEILNRFDLLAGFGKLRYESTRRITDLHVEAALEVQRGLGHNVTVSDAARESIRQNGFSTIFGARPIRREAMKVISRAIRSKKSAPGERVNGEINYMAATQRVTIE